MNIYIEEFVFQHIIEHSISTIGGLELSEDPEGDKALINKIVFLALRDIQQNKDNITIASNIVNQLLLAGFMVNDDIITNIVMDIKEKCSLELFVFGVACDLLYNLKEDPFVVLSKVQKLLP